MNYKTNTKTKNNDFEPLSKEEHALIMGTVLGDGHIQKRGQNSYRLKIDHTIDQEDLVLWKYKKLKRLCVTTQPPKKVPDKKGYEGIEFYTSSGLYLEKYHSLFYIPEKKENSEKIRYCKKITPKLIDSLPTDPLVIATFYMDDGSVRNDCYAGKLATQGFSYDENQLLIQYFAKCGITGCKVVTHTVESGQYYISFPAETGAFKKLVSFVEPIIKEVPCMAYKSNEANIPRND